MKKEDILCMTVGELLETDLKIKLVTNKGSSFIFCGYAKDMDLDKMDREILESYNRLLDNARRKVKTLSSKPLTFDVFLKEMEKKGTSKNTPLTKTGHKAWKEKIKRSIDTANNTIKANEEKLKFFTPLCGRQIVDTYPSIDERNTHIVIFEGCENGKYWTTKECQTGIIETDGGNFDEV